MSNGCEQSATVITVFLPPPPPSLHPAPILTSHHLYVSSSRKAFCTVSSGGMDLLNLLSNQDEKPCSSIQRVQLQPLWGYFRNLFKFSESSCTSCLGIQVVGTRMRDKFRKKEVTKMSKIRRVRILSILFFRLAIMARFSGGPSRGWMEKRFGRKIPAKKLESQGQAGIPDGGGEPRGYLRLPSLPPGLVQRPP